MTATKHTEALSLMDSTKEPDEPFEYPKGWIGVDLDGTLAEYHGFQGAKHIGPPIQKMANRVRTWLADGKDVKIFTARAAHAKRGDGVIEAIETWCLVYLGMVLEVTATKDFGMIELWDDRAVGVIFNTGEVR